MLMFPLSSKFTFEPGGIREYLPDRVVFGCAVLAEGGWRGCQALAISAKL